MDVVLDMISGFALGGCTCTLTSASVLVYCQHSIERTFYYSVERGSSRPDASFRRKISLPQSIRRV